MADDTCKTLIQSSLKLSPTREQEMVKYVLESIQAIKRERGHIGPGQYQRDSWMWMRAIATARFKNDFRDRLNDPSTNVWRNRNVSWNQAKVFVNQNTSRMARDYNGKFFAVTPEGVEDGHPALKPAERYFHLRAEQHKLGDKIVNDGIRAAFIRGESVYRAVPNRTLQRCEREVRLVLDAAGGKPVKDSKGEYVTELDLWLADPNDPNVEFLIRDPNVRRQGRGLPMELSEQKRRMLVTESMPTGCDLSFPYWGDVFISTYAPSIDAAEVKGYEWEMKVDDVFDSLPNHLLTSQADAYYDQFKAGHSDGAKTEHLTPRRSLNDLDEKQETLDPGALGRQHYAEVCFRWAVDVDTAKRPRRADLAMILDIENSWPIWYGPAEELFGKGRKHPLGVLRVRPVEGRWYGTGHYEEHLDLCEEVDADLCRLSIEKAKSGNILLENPNATEEGKAGLPLAFRTPSTYKKVGQATKEDVLEVITVQAQVTEILTTLDKNMQALTARGGMLTPGETEQSGLDAANTLGGLQILDQTKTVANDALEAELERGIDAMLATWMQMEVENPDLAQLEDLLAGAEVPDVENAVPMPAAPEPAEGSPGAPARMDAAEAEKSLRAPVEAEAMPPPLAAPMVKESTLVMRLLGKLKGRRAASALKVVRTKSRATQVIATQQNIKVLLDEYAKLPAPLRKAMKEQYLAMLQALDAPDPQKALDAVDAAMEEVEASMAAMPPAGGPAGEPPPISDPRAPAEGVPEPVEPVI